MKRKFEEILEECLAAQLEGRRSIEESLSLYPSLASELEPLLRTATGLAWAFQEFTPPAHLEDRGRFRFLARSRERLQARKITRGVNGFGRPRAWGLRQWGMLGSAVAAGVALMVAVGVSMTDGGLGDSGPEPPVVRDGDEPSADDRSLVSDFQRWEDALERMQTASDRGLPVAEDDVQEIQRVTNRVLEEEIPDNLAAQVTRIIPKQAEVLQEVIASQPEGTEELGQALGLTVAVANQLNISLPTPEATPSPSQPVATPGPTETPRPTPEPTPEPTPVPTEAPTPTPGELHQPF